MYASDKLPSDEEEGAEDSATNDTQVRSQSVGASSGRVSLVSPDDRGEVEIPDIISEEMHPHLERLKELLYVDPRVSHLAIINIVQGGYGEVLAYPCGISPV